MHHKRYLMKLLNYLVVLLSIIYIGANPNSVVEAATTIRYVDGATGIDTGNCSSSGTPCATIQYAINKSASGNTILVAAGTYTYNSQVDYCSQNTGIRPAAVICYVDKSLTILGGYSNSNWSTANPLLNLTVIDGQNSHRGVDWVGYSNQSTIYLDMEGFTIQNGLAQGPNNNDSTGMGGGMLGQYVTVILRDMVFKNNQSIGQNKDSGVGGQADGAGLRIESAPGSGSLLQRVVFDNNKSYGGTGGDRGGIAFGAMSIFFSSVTVEDSIFSNNLAQGGNSTGSGIGDGLHADALGGAISIENVKYKNGNPQASGTVDLRRITVNGNQIIGGNASNANGTGGGAFGGAIVVEYASSFTIIDSNIINNSATAGNAHTGGNTGGGAICAADNSEITIERTRLIHNSAIGGNGTSGGNAGTGAGGGMYLFATHSGSHHATLNNVIIADNQAFQGSSGVQQLGNGSGGGIQIDGINADIHHATIARNQIGTNLVLGQGVMIQPWIPASLPASVNMNYSIIANHTGGNANAAAIVVEPGSTLTLNQGLFAGNTRNINKSPENIPVPPGNIYGLATMLSASTAGFVSAGTPNYDYHILTTSPAKDQATGSSMPDDLDYQPRPYGSARDIGADEYVLPSLSASPNSFSVITDKSTQISRSAVIGVSSGPLVGWSAGTISNWLYLGPSGTSKQSNGNSGESLVFRLVPGNVGLGSYDATIEITSPSALPVTINVHLLKVDILYQINIPLILRP